MKKLYMFFLLVLITSCKKPPLPLSFSNSALLDDKIPDVKDIHIPDEWAKLGVKPEDVVEAAKFGIEVAFPNSIKAVRFFRKKNCLLFICVGVPMTQMH
jgi:hypothetical protein